MIGGQKKTTEIQSYADYKQANQFYAGLKSVPAQCTTAPIRDMDGKLLSGIEHIILFLLSNLSTLPRT